MAGAGVGPSVAPCLAVRRRTGSAEGGALSWGDHGALKTEQGTFELGRPVELTGGESAASAEVSDDTHIPRECDLTKPRWTVN